MKCLFLVLSLMLNFSQLAGQSPSSPSPSVQQTVKTTEIFLDVLVHDKKGKIVRDLKSEELEVFEDGVKQPISSFRFIDSVVQLKNASSGSNVTPPVSAEDEFKSGNLVTLVFDHQDAQRFETTRQAAVTFMDTAMRPDTLVRVMVIGRKLYLIEQYSNDRNKIYKAIEKALGTSEKSFAQISELKMKELIAKSGSPEVGVSSGTALDNSDSVLTKMTIDTMTQSEKMLNEAGVSSPVFPLLSVARNHRKLSGRKMVFYFSNGLYFRNAGLSEILRNVVSDANQANLTFYAINTRQTMATTGNMNSRLETATVVNATQRPESGTVGSRDPFSSFQGRNSGGTAAFDPRSSFTAFESRGRNSELNKQNPLTELTESTGGAVLQNINDISTVLKQAVSELGIFYAVTYTPTKSELDGKFRQVTVKLARTGLKAQTRNGYFAVPTTTTRPVLTFETPMLAALNNSEVPHDFDYRVSTLHFEARTNERHEVFMVEAPLSSLIQNEDKTLKAYPVNFAILMLVKNAKGEIVQKYNDSYTLEIPSAQVEEAKQSSINLVRHSWLPTGNYLLETVIHDQKGNRLSASRRPFSVTGSKAGINAGSLYLVKQIDQVGEDSIESENPFFAGNLKIVPELSETITAQENGEIPFYLNLYPELPISSPPTLQIEFSREGKVIATTTPTLPKADDRGVLSFSAGIPTKGLTSGDYRIRAIARQGSNSTEESIAFTVKGTASSTSEPVDNIKAITSTIASPTDRVSELALVSLTSAKSVELSVNKLIEDTEKNGALMHQRLGDYTYMLRKVRRTFDKKARLRTEEYKDYEAYPVKGQHALVQMSANGSNVSVDRIGVDRKQATEAIIKNEEEKQNSPETKQPRGYWSAGLAGMVQGKNLYLSINPTLFFKYSEFSTPRLVTLDGRETIVMEYHTRSGLQLEMENDWIQKMSGNIWIDFTDKVLVRIEGQVKSEIASSAQSMPNFVYQQQRVGVGLWSPALIRINSLGDSTIFRGLNYDAWFEFSNFKRFDSAESDVKITAPKESKETP